MIDSVDPLGIQIDHNQCISCGNCISHCVPHVRRYKDDSDGFFLALQQGIQPISVVFSPDFNLTYPNAYKNVLGYLKSLGVKNFYSAGFGADINTWGYLNYIKSNDTAGHISSSCPTIVNQIEKHLPEYLPKLVPIQNPMMCTAIYIKKYLGLEGDIAFIGSCIGQKTEIEHSNGLVKYNVTLKNLMQHIESMKINLDDFPQVDSALTYGMGAMVPMPGGQRENIQYYLGHEAMIAQIDGVSKMHDYLKSLNEDETAPQLIDVLGCHGGCCHSAGVNPNHINQNNIDYQAFLIQKQNQNQATPSQRLAQLNENFKHLNLDDFKRTYEANKNTVKEKVSESEINQILINRLKKCTNIDQHINCTACGYKTCKEMATAIALGINNAKNCMFFIKNKLAQLTEEKISAEISLRSMINLMPMVSNFLDDGQIRVINCNNEALRLFGLNNVGEYKTIFHKLTPVFQPDGSHSETKAQELFHQAIKTGLVRAQWVYQKPDGERIPCDITLVRFGWHDENRVLTFIMDKREFYKFQEASRLAEQRLNAILDTSPLVCTIFDKNYNITSVNQKVEILFEIEDKNIFVNNQFQFSPKFQPDGSSSREKSVELLAKAFENGFNKFEWAYQTSSGSLIPCEETLVRVNFDGVDYVICYTHDLREQKATLAQLEEAVGREQLANKAKTRFLARMSHEIRTPMNSVLGITELELQKDIHSFETEEAFTRIYSASNLLLTIINDILDLSKVEAGRMEIIPVVYETASMIIDTVQLNIMYIGSKRIDFVLKVDENLPSFLIGDELRVKQILNNFLSNAFKYTLSGVVSLSFAVEPTDSVHDVIIVIKIKDTGQGMDEKQIENLFADDYTRYNMESNYAIEGSGLGINIAGQLISMMGGTVSVESEPEMGSEFTIRLPQSIKDKNVLGAELANGLQNLEDTQMSLKRLSKMEREPMPYGKVLVVDDVESNLYVAKGFLMPYKIAVDVAESGFEAINKVKKGAIYDIIFMDHMMPKMDGVETTRILREELEYDHPIVALTANAFSDMAEMFMANGFSGYASKPIDTNQIDKYLTRFIRDKQSSEVIAQARMAQYQLTEEENTVISEMLVASFINDARKSIDALKSYDLTHISGENLKAFIIHVHSMKSALFNVGKNEMSVTASLLERAGRNSDVQTIKTEAPAFLAQLIEIANELELAEARKLLAEDDEENMVFFKAQMLIVYDACESFDIDTARDVLKELNQKSYTKQTKVLLDEISDKLISGDFDEAGELAKKAAHGGVNEY